MQTTAIGIIGGTGLYRLDAASAYQTLDVNTPFGQPSSPITAVSRGDLQLYFIARHGIQHQFLPSEVNYRANIFALKQLGVKWCVGINAVGSLQEAIAPGHVVVPDQIIDRTRGRISTFFGEGISAHIAFADPFCPILSELLAEAAQEAAEMRETVVHRGGTYLCMEGPAFSTRAESAMYRSFGASIIGMTAIPEAKLAREAEIAYASLALVTDYDCWRSAEADVDINDIMAVLAKNADLAIEVLRRLSPKVASATPSELAANALASAVVSDPNAASAELRARLKPILSRYITTD